MKTIVIPLLKTVNSIGVAGPIEILTKTCPLWQQLSEGKSRAPLFEVQVVSENGKPVTFANGITIRPNANIGRVKPDLIVVPSIDEELHALKRNKLLLAWIKESYQ